MVHAVRVSEPPALLNTPAPIPAPPPPPPPTVSPHPPAAAAAPVLSTLAVVSQGLVARKRAALDGQSPDVFDPRTPDRLIVADRAVAHAERPGVEDAAAVQGRSVAGHRVEDERQGPRI